jgi:hypothetical protein
MAGTTSVSLLWFLTCMQLSLPGPNSVMPDDRGITFLEMVLSNSKLAHYQNPEDCYLT